MQEPRTIVIGGGLAGLTAAATLSRAGRPVTLLESSEHLGGRARTRHRDGFDLNLGPHALYRAGGGLAVLRRLGVRVAGRIPRVDRAAMLLDGHVVSAFDHLRRSTRDRVGLVRALAGLGEWAADRWAGRPAGEWLDAVTVDPEGRAIVASVVRTATYCADHTLLDAGAAARQLRAAAHGVLYVHHGWSTLVEGLSDAICESGGQIRTRASVAAVDHDEVVHGVRLADGETVDAEAVVIAVNDPHRAAGLLAGAAATRVGAAAAAAVPVRMAHLDLAVRPLPQRRYPLVLGLDEPIFLTVQSSVADVAPPGGAVIHVARYLRPGEEHGDHRAVLERVLDAAQPDWRDHVVDARYVPRSTVSGDHARAATCGAAGRPATDLAGMTGLAVAGDWVGPAGMLADASILSGSAAAKSVMSAMLLPVSRSNAMT